MKIETLLTALRPHAIDIDTLVFMSDPTGVVSINHQQLTEYANVPHGKITIIHIHGGDPADKRTVAPPENLKSASSSEGDLDTVADLGRSSKKFNPIKTCVVYCNYAGLPEFLLSETGAAFASVIFIFI